jgi:hypothetical protein
MEILPYRDIECMINFDPNKCDFRILHVKIYYGDVGIDMDKLKSIWNKTEINCIQRDF